MMGSKIGDGGYQKPLEPARPKIRIVLATGAFDVIHKGHIKFLTQAKELGDALIVVVARDETVKQIKGKAPINSEEHRVMDVSLIPAVDKAVLGYTDDKYKIIEDIKPDIIALGYDQKAFTDKLSEELKKRHLLAKVVRIKPFAPGQYKSSKLKAMLPFGNVEAPKEEPVPRLTAAPTQKTPNPPAIVQESPSSNLAPKKLTSTTKSEEKKTRAVARKRSLLKSVKS